jgi:DNA-binding protein HU-beta
VNKEELVERVASKTGLTKKDALEAVNSTLDAITGSLRKGDKVTLVGFGTFLVRRRAAREGRNPQTGAKIKIPARKVPAFTAGKDLKSAIK